jgi:hypothetical protein
MQPGDSVRSSGAWVSMSGPLAVRLVGATLGMALLLAPWPVLSQASAAATRLAPCPATGDTLSLLQPHDSAFQQAPMVKNDLERGGLVVRCVTRSVLQGLAGVGNVAGFQTSRGTITVLFVPASEHFRLMQHRTTHGYQLIYEKEGPHPARSIITTDGRSPIPTLATDGRFYEFPDSAVAAAIGPILIRPPR